MKKARERKKTASPKRSIKPLKEAPLEDYTKALVKEMINALNAPGRKEKKGNGG